MDFMPDVIAQLGVEWIFHKVDERFGAVAAWLVTLSLFAMIVGAVIMVLKAAM